MSDVFISYSRREIAFADRLVTELEKNNRTVWIDRVGIRFTAEWWEEIKRGIEASDNFVLIMSPSSLASPVCHLEIEYARQLTKRIIPLYHINHDYEGTKAQFGDRLYKDDKEGFLLKLYGNRNPMLLFEENWTILPSINRVNAFAKGTDFNADGVPTSIDEAEFLNFFPSLREAIDTDIAHVHEHTRLLLRTNDWVKSGEKSSFLLNGDETKEAEEWLLAWEQDKQVRMQRGLPPKNPQPDEHIRKYIAMSRFVENRRLRFQRTFQITLGLLAGAVVVAVVIAVSAGISASNSAQQVADANATLTQVPATLAAADAVVATAEFVDRELATAFAYQTLETDNRQREAALYLTPAAEDITFGDPLSFPDLIRQIGLDWWYDAGWGGQNIAIGVIDTSFGNLESLINQGLNVQVPAWTNVDVYSTDFNSHGTFMLTVLHRIAPASQFYACDYDNLFEQFTFLEQLQNCADFMLANDVDIIVHAGGIPILPLDGTNPFAQIASSTVENGALWINSAGNFNGGLYVTRFSDANGDTFNDFSPRVTQITSSYSGRVFVSWNANTLPSPFSVDIFDLNTGEYLAFSGGTVTKFLDEDLGFQLVNLSNIRSPFEIRIYSEDPVAAQQVPITIWVEFVPIENADIRGSVVAPGDSPDVLTVGALADNKVAFYSSRGVLDSNLLKPNLVAPGMIYLDDDRVFAGTSASGAVVGGIAAVIWSAYPDWTEEQIYNYLITEAAQDDIEIPGPDNNYGYGYIYLRPPRFRTEVDVISKFIDSSLNLIPLPTPTFPASVGQ